MIKSIKVKVFVLRLQGLEKKILMEAVETPAVVYEMKKQVDSFREKLEVRLQNSLKAQRIQEKNTTVYLVYRFQAAPVHVFIKTVGPERGAPELAWPVQRPVRDDTQAVPFLPPESSA